MKINLFLIISFIINLLLILAILRFKFNQTKKLKGIIRLLQKDGQIIIRIKNYFI